MAIFDVFLHFSHMEKLIKSWIISQTFGLLQYKTVLKNAENNFFYYKALVNGAQAAHGICFLRFMQPQEILNTNMVTES